MTERANHEAGFGKPPKSTQFRKGRSGNPRGRPRGKKHDILYDHLLGQMVTIREDGRERRVTAAEAFLLQLTKKGLEGCSASARASLASIEQARAAKLAHPDVILNFRIVRRAIGLCSIVEDLGMAIRVNATSEGNVRLELKPWVVQAAVERMADKQLSVDEQTIVVASTRIPEKVRWPDWWSVTS